MKIQVILWMVCVLPAAAVEFDSAFSSGMVIQRDAAVTLSGKGHPGHDVVVSLGEETKSARVTDAGHWSVEFPPMKAGGSRELKAADGAEETTLDDVLCGDVWLCSGQSNMYLPIREVAGGHDALARAAAMADLRFLPMPEGGADKLRKNFDAKWRRINSESGGCSAVALFFALHLKADPLLKDIPLGLLTSTLGGTAVEAWTPAGSLPDIPVDQISGSFLGIKPGELFNGMIAPLTGLHIKGVLWYQGEANSGHASVYPKLLENMIGQWRAAWNQPELPFFVVQLPAYDGRVDGYDFGWLREAQEKACAATANAWLAVTYDTNDGHNLHPVEKEEIGRRLALLARREIYREDIVASGPEFQAARVEGNKLRVIFKNPDGLATRGGMTPAGFDIAAAGGDYRHANATLDGDTVLLDCADVLQPETVRYAWGPIPAGNLTNRAGLPAVPFRTDALLPGKVTIQTLPVTRQIVAPHYQLTTGENGQIASLIVRGEQFLSNESGGGTRFPDAFGPRNFGTTEELGPRRLRTSDNIGSLEIAAADDSMEWILSNDRDREIEFYIALSHQAKLNFHDAIVEVSRGDVKIRIEGADHVGGIQTPEVVAKIPAHSKLSLRVVLPR